jgi:hypothetical protein
MDFESNGAGWNFNGAFAQASVHAAEVRIQKSESRIDRTGRAPGHSES